MSTTYEKSGLGTTRARQPGGPTADAAGNLGPATMMPSWLPDAAKLYLDHTEHGISLRALARKRGCHASTVLRQVRRYENRRDDPLVDEALNRLGQVQRPRFSPCVSKSQEGYSMTAPPRSASEAADDARIHEEGARILRKLAEPGAVLAIAANMEKAAVLKSGPDGLMVQIAVLDRTVAQAFALKDWIICQKAGKISTYGLSPAGRLALKRLAGGRAPGFSEQATPFENRSRGIGVGTGNEDAPKSRYGAAESPVSMLARRRDKDGRAFLEDDLVEAAERLREDFELAQMGPRVTQNWDRFLTSGDRSAFRPDLGPSDGSRSARDRVALALRDLGPGLGDVALRCCCFMEGLEAAEQRMGWAARSGKIVLRIALQRLRRHYDEAYGRSGPLIG